MCYAIKFLRNIDTRSAREGMKTVVILETFAAILWTLGNPKLNMVTIGLSILISVALNFYYYTVSKRYTELLKEE